MDINRDNQNYSSLNQSNDSQFPAQGRSRKRTAEMPEISVPVASDTVNASHASAEQKLRESRAARATKSNAQKEKMKKLRRIIIFAIAEVITLIGIFIYAYALRQYGKIQRPDIDEDEVKNKNLSVEDIERMETGYWNIALFGVDSRDSSVGKGANSDVIIIASINRENGEIKLVSVFRDTYLKTDDSTYAKINAAYCNGGPEQALKALNENLDLNITDYATFNWKAVATGINILGGVDIELSNAEFYYINSYITSTVEGTGIGSVQLSHAGMNHLDGIQAVAYARLRYMDNDYARTERQRKVISLCFDKAKTASLQTLNDLLGNMLSMVATNLTWQDGIDAIAEISKYSLADTGGFPFARGEAVVGKRGSCVIPQTLESNVKELHSFLFGEEDYQPSDAVKAISAKISADSGMYNEGTVVGHVSTVGAIIPNVPGAPSSSSESSDAEVSEDSEDGDNENSENADTENSETEADKSNKLEYAISSDGYLLYVDGYDSDGNKKYKYVLDDNNKRIKMIERDADGNLVYLYEVDEDGNFYFDGMQETTKESTTLSEIETDENGNPVIKQTEEQGPGTTKPTAATDATKATSETKATSPTSPTSETKATSPSVETTAVTPTAPSSETTAAAGPGESEPGSSNIVPTAPAADVVEAGPGA